MTQSKINCRVRSFVYFLESCELDTDFRALPLSCLNGEPHNFSINFYKALSFTHFTLFNFHTILRDKHLVPI